MSRSNNNTVRLSVEPLDSREMPAYLFAGGIASAYRSRPPVVRVSYPIPTPPPPQSPFISPIGPAEIGRLLLPAIQP